MMLLYVTFSFEGFHKYEDAPTSVAYLRDLHRHIFYVTVYIPVDDLSSRDLEFHMVKELLQTKLPVFVNINDTGSCEDICRRIHNMCHVLLGNPCCKVKVSEDNENGAYYDPNR